MALRRPETGTLGNLAAGFVFSVPDPDPFH
jgi:hypothetical protein